MTFALADIFWATIVLALLLIASRFIRQNTTLFRRLFLPSSILAGTAALLLGPEVLPAVTAWFRELQGGGGMVPHLIAALVIGALVLLAVRVADTTPRRVIYAATVVLIGGGLWLLGPEHIVRSPFPAEMVSIWSGMPGLLINVVFAALLMGKPLPGLRTIWQHAGPQVCFGQTVAWGQYVIGILLAILVLGPVWGMPPAAGALIEIGFEGGHGTAAGMGEAFDAVGFTDGQDLALGLATVGLVGGVVIGTILINWAAKRGVIQPVGGSLADVEVAGEAVSEPTEQEIAQIRMAKDAEMSPTDPLSLHVGLVALAIVIGWLLLEGLQRFELATWARGEDATTIFTYIPLFPLAMIGGVIIQAVFDKLGRSHLISARLMQRISGVALDFTIVAALGALSIQAIGANLGPFLLLALAGMVWTVFAVLVIAPRIIPTGWFERGIGDFGQSMGVTVTGLLLMRVADPPNRSGALESFGYKQLLFEPIVGGGLFTGASVALLTSFGSGPILILTAAITTFWIVFGLIMFGKDARRNRALEQTG